MNNFKVWLFAVVVTTVTVVVLGSMLLISIANAPGSVSPSPSPTATASATPQPITVTGNLTCLPHRSQNGPVTLECALGLNANGTYYSLGNLAQDALSTPTDTTIRVTGTLDSSSPDATYATVGTIVVTKFERL